jgi:hypothetical protein
MSIYDAPITLDPAFLTDPEIDETLAPADPEQPSDEDWAWYLEAAYVDPAEAAGPCCADPWCTCGGYVGNRHAL